MLRRDQTGRSGLTDGAFRIARIPGETIGLHPPEERIDPMIGRGESPAHAEAVTAGLKAMQLRSVALRKPRGVKPVHQRARAVVVLRDGKEERRQSLWQIGDTAEGRSVDRRGIVRTRGHITVQRG
jgi:hypothetical protein